MNKMEPIKNYDDLNDFYKSRGPWKKGKKDSLKKHPQYSKSDYNYLKKKGYNDKEIKKIWDKDINRSKIHKEFEKPKESFFNKK